MIRISKRLAAIGALVTQGNRLADVGCDHGYLPIYLLQRRHIPRAIAMDVRPGPLSRAKENIEAYGLLDYIELRISDGLEALEPGEAQTVVVAGMGGPLMEGILTRGVRQLACVRELILQPQSHIEHFRRFLRKLPFTVVCEDMVLEEGKYYPMMRLARGEPKDEWVEAEYRYGKYLLRHRHPVLGDYLHREEEKLRKLEEELRLAGGSRAVVRLEQIRKDRAFAREALEKYGFDK